MNKTTKHNADFINAILTGEAGQGSAPAQTAAELELLARKKKAARKTVETTEEDLAVAASAEEAILEMAGGGFESTVRLAKSSPEMWAPIFHQNKNYLLEVMDTYIEKMYHFRNLINKNKTEELKEFMNSANEIRKILK